MPLQVLMAKSGSLLFLNKREKQTTASLPKPILAHRGPHQFKSTNLDIESLPAPLVVAPQFADIFFSITLFASPLPSIQCCAVSGEAGCTIFLGCAAFILFECLAVNRKVLFI